MKTPLKFLGATILSLLVGIAFASPLFVSEIKPTVQGETANFQVNAIYLNITVSNPDSPITSSSGPTIEYLAVFNITNLSNLKAWLDMTQFMASENAGVNNVVDRYDYFENISSIQNRDFDNNGKFETIELVQSIQSVHHLTREGFFNNNWCPNQSRLIAINGSWSVTEALKKPLDALKPGILTLWTTVWNYANSGGYLVNNTWVSTYSKASELKQVQMTKNGNSYLYNPLVIDEKALQFDKWSVEVVIKPRS